VRYGGFVGELASAVLTFGAGARLLRSGVRQVRVPLAALKSAALWDGEDARLPKVVLQAERMVAVRDVPGMSLGRIELAVSWEDREAALAFVASLHRLGVAPG
jgi:hypothetical protein